MPVAQRMAAATAAAAAAKTVAKPASKEAGHLLLTSGFRLVIGGVASNAMTKQAL